MTEHKDIGARLENWSRWCRTWGNGMGGGGADCMTGAVCERMRKAALGNVWSGHGEAPPEDSDAVKIERCMRFLPNQQRLLLWWCYIKNAAPEMVCRKLSIPIRPSSVFVEQFRAAQEAIEDLVDGGNE